MKKIYFFIILSILSAFYINANNVNINNNINEHFSNIKHSSNHFEEYYNDSVTNRTRYRADYVGDINAEAQRICFNSEGTYTYPLNPNGYGYDEADVLNPNIDFDLKDGNNYDLIAPTWFYIEPTTPLGFSIKVTKTITSGEGTNIDYICFRVPKSADPLALTPETTGVSNVLSYDYVYNNDGYFTIDFPADPNEEYNYVLATFNMWENYGDASPTGNIVFELVEPEIPTELTMKGALDRSYGCPGEEYTYTLSEETTTDNPQGTKYHYVVKFDETIIAEEKSYEHSFSFTPYMQNENYLNTFTVIVTATYDPGYLCDDVVLTNKATNRTLRIYKKPTADFTYTASCKTVTFTSTSTNINTGSAAPYPYYTWIIKDKAGNVLHTVSGSVANNSGITTLEYPFEEDGEYDVTLQAAHSSSKTSNKNQCYDEITKTITVTIPDASFTVNPNPAGRGETVTFTINNYNGNYSYSWDFDNGKVATGGPSVTTTYTSLGTYNVTLTVRDGDCEESSTEEVIISDCEHSAEFTINPNPCCQGEPFLCTVKNHVEGATYYWTINGGNPKTTYDGKVTYTEFTTGNLPMKLEMTVNGCTVSKTVYVEILPKPSVQSISANNSEVCEGEAITFSYTGGINILTNTEFHWDFGNGDTSNEKNPTYAYPKTNDYSITQYKKTVTLTLKSENGCESSPVSTEITINKKPDATFEYTPVCINEEATFTIVNPVQGAYYEWLMNEDPKAQGYNKTSFQNIDGSGSAIHFKVIVTAPNGCTDTYEKSVTYNSKPVVQSISATPTEICKDETIQFSSTYTEGNDGVNINDEFIWDFGDGKPTSNDREPSHQYTAAGDYIASLVVKRGSCESDPLTLNIKVYDTPEAKITSPAEGTAVCEGEEITFTAKEVTGATYEWDLYGDEAVDATGQSVTYSFDESGTKTIKLLVSVGGGTCKGEDEISVTINEKPSIEVDPDSEGVCEGNSIIFTATNFDGASYKWTVNGEV
ncbi:MAG: PKD domain-containing protein, partial [Bacteroidales bacterium]|nr:PKD domain-containing protein [Bacteroidales bacterium]